MRYTDLKVGVFVDAESIADSGGYGMRFDVLRDFAVRDVVGQPLMLNAYVPRPDPAEEPADSIANARNFRAALRDFGYRVVQAEAPEDALADEILDRSERLDRVLLATRDEGALAAVERLVNRGLRVELVSFQDVPPALAEEVDLFMSGFLIANLLPTRGGHGGWGDEGSRVRGVCYSFQHDRGFGFIRYMAEFGDLTQVDTRQQGSPYRSAFCHESELPTGVNPSELPSREFIFEFTLVDSDKGLQARDIVVV